MGLVVRISGGILLLIFFIGASVCIGSPHYHLKQISIREGLSQSSVKSILRDHYGRLWIGTKNGLNRFDGENVKNYFHHQNNNNGLPDNYIFFIAEDINKQIWVGTKSGLVKYAPAKDVFEAFSFGEASSSSVYSNYLFVGDKMVFGSDRHIVVFNPKNNKAQLLPFKGAEQGLPLSYQMIPWGDNKILLASRWKGAYICDLSTGELGKATFIPDENLLSVFVDSREQLWVSVYKQGVKLYDKTGDFLRHYHTGNSGLKNDIVLAINTVEDEVWLGTDGGGIQVFDVQSESFSSLDGLPASEQKNALNSVSVIYRDEFSGVWLGTINGGALSIKKVFISSYSDAPFNNSQGLSSQAVLSLYEDAQGLIWVGTDGGGINAYHPNSGYFTHFAKTNYKKVNAIAGISNHKLLINCFGEGLKFFDKASGILEDFKANLLPGAFMPGKGFLGIGLLRINNNQVLILEDSIHLYDFNKEQLRLVTSSEMLQGEGELKIAGFDGYSVVLYGKRGVYQLQVDGGYLSLLCEMPSGQVINTACWNTRSTVWVSTTSGLYAYNVKSKTLETVRTDLTRSITCLVKGKEDDLWMGVGADLVRYNNVDGTLRYFGRSDGVMPNEYYPKSVLLSKTGDVYMGGVAGMVHIYDTDIKDDRSPQDVYITDIHQDGKVLSDKKLLAFERYKTITLPWAYTSFYFRVVVKDEDFFKEKRIKYQVAGYTKEAIETSESKIDLSLLPPGSYPVLIQNKLKNGLWSQPRQVMEVSVLSPFWLTGWFKLILFAFLFVVVMVIWLLMHKRHKHKIKLEVAEKDRLLNEKKMRFLINVSHEIRTPLSLIYGPLEQLIKNETMHGDGIQLLKVMQRQVNYLKNLVNQVLDLNKIEIASEDVQMESLGLNEWLKEVVSDFEHELQLGHIQIEWDLDDSIAQIDMDGTACKKVVYNFMRNAINYAGQSEKFTWITKRVEGDRVEVALVDQGPGLPGSAEEVFERYYRGDRSTSGYGIGLAYSKSIIETLGGQVGAENVQPNGARFFFQLPIQSVLHGQPALSANTVQNVASLPEMGEELDEKRIALFKNLTLLIVEDNQELSGFLCSMFKGAFKKVLVAGNGAEGLKLARLEQPDMVVSDVMMPEMNGTEMCREIKADLSISHIPVILLTARQDEQGVDIGYKMGADVYLTKPFSIEVLSNAIFNLLLSRKHLHDKYRKTLSPTFAQVELTASNADDLFLEKLNGLISKELANPELGVDMLVDRLAISRATLYTKVKNILGIGVSSFINDQRLNAAKQLLETTQIPVSEVADKVGFVNQSYFSTLFKQHFGSTPSAYRNLQR